jgi:hypothetical protein
MTLQIDPQTGRAVGGPRQVSSGSVSRGGRVSPDGRWFPYITTDQRVMVVPTNGGEARELARAASTPVGVMFSPDSRHLYYTETRGGPGPVEHALMRVPVAGGKAEQISAGPRPMRILPGDPRYMVVWAGLPGQTSTVELRRVDGTLVRQFALPRGNSTPVPTGDGLGWMVQVGSWKSSVRVIPVEGGPAREVVGGGAHWPEAWLGNDTLVTDRLSGDNIVFEVFPLTGGAARAFRLPFGADQTGWHSSVGPWLSYRIADSARSGQLEDAIHAVNVVTGEQKLVAPRSSRVPISGRGGAEDDAGRWVYALRDGPDGPVEVRTVDPGTGATTLVRRFPAGFAFGVRGLGFRVHGAKLAYMVARGDSLDLMLTEGPTGPPRRLATFNNAGAMTWSNDGTRIALSAWVPGNPRQPGIHVITLPTRPGQASEVKRYVTGGDTSCDMFRWTPDDSQILMLCYAAQGRILSLRPADGTLKVVLPSETPQEIWEIMLSPDGKRIAYPVQRNAGSVVQVLDFKPYLAPRP